MKQRTISGMILTLYVSAMLFFGGWVFNALMSIIMFLATYEMAHAITRKGLQPIVTPAYMLALAMPAVYKLYGSFAVGIAFMVCILVSIAFIVFSRQLDAGRAMGTLVLYVYPLVLLFCLFLCYEAFPRGLGLTAFIIALGVPSLCDVFAYLGGSLFGKHKLAPDISPKKTVEGAVSGIIGGLLCGVIIFYVQRCFGAGLPLWLLLLLGGICSVLGQIGDLFASIIKRWTEIKDYSSLIPGHGGVLDRLDSILLCAPMVLIAVSLWGMIK